MDMYIARNSEICTCTQRQMAKIWGCTYQETLEDDVVHKKTRCSCTQENKHDLILCCISRFT